MIQTCQPSISWNPLCTRRDIQFRKFHRNVPWSTCFHIGVVAIKAIRLPNRPNWSLIGLRKKVYKSVMPYFVSCILLMEFIMQQNAQPSYEIPHLSDMSMIVAISHVKFMKFIHVLLQKKCHEFNFGTYPHYCVQEQELCATYLLDKICSIWSSVYMWVSKSLCVDGHQITLDFNQRTPP